MATAKEIRHQIKSIQSTQKITHAMEMVAASKMRKAQDRMRASRPYFKRVKEVIAHLVQSRLEYSHPYLIDRPVKNILYVVISSDRGLCGGLNNNLFKKIIKDILTWQAQGVNAHICTIWRKAEVFFTRQNVKLLASITDLGDYPKVKDLFGIIKVFSDAFVANELDRIYLGYNEFVSSIAQTPKLELLLPVLGTVHDSAEPYWDYIYEPEPKLLLNILLRRYVESLVYQGVVENIASEQASRMLAMKNATDNACNLIEDFRLMYNKARQAAITKELAEIVAGAAAV